MVLGSSASGVEASIRSFRVVGVLGLGLGFRFREGFRVWDSKARVLGLWVLGLWVWASWFRVQGGGFGDSGHPRVPLIGRDPKP